MRWLAARPVQGQQGRCMAGLAGCRAATSGVGTTESRSELGLLQIRPGSFTVVQGPPGSGGHATCVELPVLRSGAQKLHGLSLRDAHAGGVQGRLFLLWVEALKDTPCSTSAAGLHALENHDPRLASPASTARPALADRWLGRQEHAALCAAGGAHPAVRLHRLPGPGSLRAAGPLDRERHHQARSAALTAPACRLALGLAELVNVNWFRTNFCGQHMRQAGPGQCGMHARQGLPSALRCWSLATAARPAAGQLSRTGRQRTPISVLPDAQTDLAMDRQLRLSARTQQGDAQGPAP